MLKLTKKADYGLIALKHLAVSPGGLSASAKDIAECYGIPQPLLAKILQKHTKIGLLQRCRDPAEATGWPARRARSPPSK